MAGYVPVPMPAQAEYLEFDLLPPEIRAKLVVILARLDRLEQQLTSLRTMQATHSEEEGA